MGRGGKRPGAGRKSQGLRVTISARVSQATKETIDRLRAQGITTGQLLDRLLAGFQNEDK